MKIRIRDIKPFDRRIAIRTTWAGFTLRFPPGTTASQAQRDLLDGLEGTERAAMLNSYIEVEK